jgi:hypothetical protein
MKKIIMGSLLALLALSSMALAGFDFTKAPEKLTAYYASEIQSVDALKTKLEANGFEVLATNDVLEGKTVISITNDELKATNTYMAVINILVNPEAKEVRVQNPSYLGAAYLQDKYTYGQFKATLTALEKVLGTMNEVSDVYKLNKLAKYHFMLGMPYFADTIGIAEGVNLEEKLKDTKAAKYFAYSLKLPNGNTLVGNLLRSRTNKFLNKIEAQNNAQLLPYQSMVQEGKVVILNPKFYLALSLPLLSMGDFMKIANAPDEIEKDIKRAYK